MPLTNIPVDVPKIYPCTLKLSQNLSQIVSMAHKLESIVILFL